MLNTVTLYVKKVDKSYSRSGCEIVRITGLGLCLLVCQSQLLALVLYQFSEWTFETWLLKPIPPDLNRPVDLSGCDVWRLFNAAWLFLLKYSDKERNSRAWLHCCWHPLHCCPELSYKVMQKKKNCSVLLPVWINARMSSWDTTTVMVAYLLMSSSLNLSINQ